MTLRDGQRVRITSDNKEEVLDTLNQFKRSHFPTQQYPFVHSREDGFFDFHQDEGYSVMMFADQSYYFFQKDQMKIQDLEGVFVLRETLELKKWFEQKFLEQFQHHYFLFELEGEKRLHLMAKKDAPGFLAIFSSVEEIILVDENGRVLNLPLELTKDLKSEVANRMKTKKKLDHFYKSVTELAQTISKADEKFQKSKKKKKKDQERHEEMKAGLEEQFRKQLVEYCQVIDSGKEPEV